MPRFQPLEHGMLGLQVGLAEGIEDQGPLKHGTLGLQGWGVRNRLCHFQHGPESLQHGQLGLQGDLSKGIEPLEHGRLGLQVGVL